MNAACSSQSGCSRVLFECSRFSPAAEITTNVFFIAGYDPVYSPQINVVERLCQTPGVLQRATVLGRARHSRARRSLLTRRAEDCPPYPLLSFRFRIAAAQTGSTVILTNERTCSRSKFGSKKNHPGASRARRGFHAVADRRRCDEFDLVSRQDSSGRWDDCILGTLSGGRICCVVLRDRLRAVAAGTRAAERNVRA